MICVACEKPAGDLSWIAAPDISFCPDCWKNFEGIFGHSPGEHWRAEVDAVDFVNRVHAANGTKLTYSHEGDGKKYWDKLWRFEDGTFKVKVDGLGCFQDWKPVSRELMYLMVAEDFRVIHKA